MNNKSNLALEKITLLCDNQNPTHENIWRIAHEALNDNENSDTLNEVIKDMIAREQLGIKKYGTTIDRDDYSLKDWMQHHYEELLDAALYVKKQIQKLENK